MSDAEGTGTEDEGEVRTQIVFVCTKCTDKRFTNVQEKEAHREWHREQRLQKNRPGPAPSKKNTRASSPAASAAGTLFSVKAMQPARVTKAKPTATSAKARKIKAKKVYNKHWNDAHNLTKKFNSG